MASKLVGIVCSGGVGEEALRLARSGRDWHDLIDLCALAGTLTRSEYELSLMRRRGVAARGSKAWRGEYRFTVPADFSWSEAGNIEIDSGEHVADTIRLVIATFRERGSARQVLLWLRSADIRMLVVLRNIEVYKLIWKAPAYHGVMQICVASFTPGLCVRQTGAAQRTAIIDERACTFSGFDKPVIERAAA